MGLFGPKKDGKQASLRRKAAAEKQDSMAQQHKPIASQKPFKKKAKNNYLLYGSIVVVIIIIAAAYLMLSGGGSGTVVNGPVTSNITQTGSLFTINSQQYLISLSGISISSGKAYVHISKLPIFLNPVLNVTLTLSNVTKINSGSTYANIGLELQSMSTKSITLQITPLMTSLDISPDYQYIRTVQGTLYNYGQPHGGSSGSTSVTTSASTTTVVGQSTTSATTTAETTTIAVNNTQLEINSALKQNSLYGLLLNFSRLYANTTKCTSTLYNSTYIYANGHAPNSGSSFMNVSPYVPYNLSWNTSSAGKGNYNVQFKTKTIDPVFNNTVAATILINASTKTTVSQSIASGGIFGGVNQTQLSKNYVHAETAGGACGVEV